MKNTIDFVLKNRLLVLVLGVLVMVGGYFSYRQLPIDAFPDVSPALVQVFTATEGLAPEEIEKYVTYPVEVAMSGLPHLKNTRSVSNFGISIVNVYFEDGTDLYFSRQLVSERLQEAREQIPAGFGTPQLGPISTGMGLVLFYYLDDETGKYSLEELRSIQDWLIKFQLQTVPGVTEVLGIGGWEKQFQVDIDPTELLRYDITIHDVVAQIRRNNLNVGASFIEKNAEEFVVRSIGLATKIEDLENMVIKSVDGVPVYLKHIAKVKLGGAVRRGLQTHNGFEEVVAGQVVKLYKSNTSTVIGLVEKKLQEIEKVLPKGIKLVPYYEQKTLVQAAVQTVTSALWQGILLVILTLLVFLGTLRPSLVVTLSIPFSLLFAFIGMRFLGISVNLMSFGGLAIAIGMIVDASIVLVENIDRIHREPSTGESFLRLVSRAGREVVRPIFFAIVIIILVFIPLFTLQGVEGTTFRPLAYAIALAMFGSLLYALLLAPVISSFLMKGGKKKPDAVPARQHGLMSGLLKLYEPVLRFMVKRRIVAVMLAVVIVVAGLFIFPRLGSEFTPTLQEGTMVIRLTMAPSIALTESTRIVLLAEKRLLKVPEISDVVTRIGRGEVGVCVDPINSAEMYVLLKPAKEWRKGLNQPDLEQLIRKAFGTIPGVLPNFTQPITMAVDELLEGVKGELVIKLFGDDLAVLKERGEFLAGVLQEVRGAADVQVDQVSGTPQLRITVDRFAIARYGINMADVQEVIGTAVGGEVAGQIFEGSRRFDIVVRFDARYRETSTAIGEILIPTATGARVPLSQLAKIEEVEGPRQITREQGQRFISIQCNVENRDIGSFVAEAQKTIAAKVSLPAGYLVTWGGQFRLQQEANKRFAVVIPITLVLIALMLFAALHSVKNALLILLNIPLALVGGVVALWVTGQNLSVPSSVGFIALFGIALENGMVLVTYFNQLLAEGWGIDDSSIRGALLRLRPVLMTAVTTGLGLIPLLVSAGTGSEVQRPLATVVIGGLVTSTILTLLVLPALYKWFSYHEQGEMNQNL